MTSELIESAIRIKLDWKKENDEMKKDIALIKELLVLLQDIRVYEAIKKKKNNLKK
jgi:hypothetical protein